MVEAQIELAGEVYQTELEHSAEGLKIWVKAYGKKDVTPDYVLLFDLLNYGIGGQECGDNLLRLSKVDVAAWLRTAAQFELMAQWIRMSFAQSDLIEIVEPGTD